MNFIDDDFHSLKQSPQLFKDNYESDFSPISRNLAFSHAFNYLLYVKNQAETNQNIGKEELSDDQLKNLREIDSSIYLGKAMAQNYLELKKEKGQQSPLDYDDIFKIVTKTFSSDLLYTIILYCIDAIFFRLGFSIFVYYLFIEVTDGNLRTAYIYCAILVGIWYISQLFKQHASTNAYVLNPRIKAALVMLLYAKISKLTSHAIKSLETGKIINLLSSDLGVLEQRLPQFLNFLTFPIVIIGCTTLLALRLGWPGFVGIAIVLLMAPISNFLSKHNCKIIQEINIYKDKRIQTTTQVIQGIKYIKLYGWEIAFRRIIQDLREQEILNYKKLSWSRSLQRAIGNSFGYMAVIVMFMLSYYSSIDLNIPIIFSTLQIIISLRLLMRNFTYGFNFYYELKEVFGRFANIFNIQNISMVLIDPDTKQPISNFQNQYQSKNSYFNSIKTQSLTKEGQIIFKNFNGYWEKELTTPSLKNINLQFHKGTYYGITGKVGSGKSGLLGSILREIPYYSGQIAINGSISYVEQEPIIFSMTIRDNILFGKVFDQKMYDHVIYASCLQSDLQMFDGRDQTMVGEKGITLSGGQKARLALARALYADSDIYILDDPISAVDAKVGKQINERCLKNLSKHKTVILVTHQIGFLYDCDQIIIMENGAVKSKGSPTLLMEELQELSNLFRGQDSEAQTQAGTGTNFFSQHQHEIMPVSIKSIKQGSVRSQQQIPPNPSPLLKEKSVTVNFNSYLKYFLSNQQNYFLLPITIILFLVSECLTVLMFRILALYFQVKQGLPNAFDQNMNLYWNTLIFLLIVSFFVLITKYYCLNNSILLANQKIHEKMISGIVHSPCEFFDVTSSGMIINKFSSDLGILDNSLSINLMELFQGSTSTIISLVNVFCINVYFIPPAFVLIGIILLFFFYSRAVVIQCKQKDLKNKSPIFRFFGQTFNGLVQIRTYCRRKNLISQFAKLIDNTTRAAIAFDITARGFMFYITLFGILLMAVGMELGIWHSTPINAGLYGITVIFLVQFSEFVYVILRQVLVVEVLMMSSERAFQIINLPSEKDMRTDYDKEIGLEDQVTAANIGEDLHKQWPKNPSIEFAYLSAKYKDDLPLVLKNIGFQVRSGEKIGIVGRTGAGKSSIIQTIFRIIEPEIGSVYSLGGYNALKMGLHSLRQHISVIPQTPFLFKGTVKQNIDPFSTSDDQDLWRVLQQSGLKKHVKSLPNQLETDISNSSQSFSVGQKQLLCLARALLRHNKILVLDEATSNVDMNTDAFIQKVLKERFSDTTVITIAHRLNTVADYDKIIVMNRGKITEAGSPHELIQKKGTFYEMVQHTGKNANAIISKARSSYEAKNIKYND